MLCTQLSLETTDGVQVNIFPAAQAGNDYLFNKSTANTQLKLKGGKKPINQNNLLSALDRTSLEQGTETIFYGLFEGKSTGNGVLRLVLRAPNGSAVASDEVYLDLLDVRNMYERAEATPEEGILPPSDPAYVPPPQIGYHPGGPGQDPFGFFPPLDETNQLIVFVHGCCMDNNRYYVLSDTMFKRLWWQGYRGRFASFRWNSDLPAVGRYNDQEFRAFKYASALQSYLADQQADLPDYEVSVVAHSMGNIVAGEALRNGARVDGYVLSQAAVPADCYNAASSVPDPQVAKIKNRPAPYTDQEMGYKDYFNSLNEQVDGLVVNFYNPEDSALTQWRRNNRDYKPDHFYSFNPDSQQSLFNNPIRRLQHVVTDRHEVMAFVSRSQTGPIGQDGKTLGPIHQQVNLNQGPYPFRDEHSAQFDRPIQTAYLYYQQLLAALGIF